MAVRVTVQLNLFAGSVANLGDDAQRALLQGILLKGELGCFALTEEGAGVLSGLIVDTTATFNAATGGFVLNSPTVRQPQVVDLSGSHCKVGRRRRKAVPPRERERRDQIGFWAACLPHRLSKSEELACRGGRRYGAEDRFQRFG